MVGEYADKEGIIPRTFEYLFNKIKLLKKESENFEINIGFIQIYLEEIQDLLNPKNKVKIRENREKNIYLENCKFVKVGGRKECQKIFEFGLKNREINFTKINEQSSRSHTLLIISIERSFIDKETNKHVKTKGVLNLVDLAGSERIKKSNLKGQRLEEAKKINYSLLVLGNCIQSLISSDQIHIPYRDSKLTRILKESIGGNSKTSLIVNISPSNYNVDESLSSLNFGSRAMKVKNTPRINSSKDYQHIFTDLSKKYDDLSLKFEELNRNYKKEVEENNNIKNGEQPLDLKEQLKELQEKFNNKENEFNIVQDRYDREIVEKEELLEIINDKMNKLKSNNKELKEKNEHLSNEVKNSIIEKKQLSSQIVLLNEMNKNNNYILDGQTKELLKKHNIDINQNINVIVIGLIKDFEQNKNDNDTLKSQINSLNNNIEQFKNYYEEKIQKLEIEKKNFLTDFKINKDQIELEKNKLLTNTNNYLEEINRKEKENNELRNDINNYNIQLKKLQNEKNKLENDNISLNEDNNKSKIIIKDLQIKNQEIIKEYNQLENKFNENKNSKINDYLNGSELKRMTITNNINEKLFSKSINELSSDISVLNNLQKEFKILEKKIDNYIPSTNSYDNSINNAKNQTNKIQKMIEDIHLMVNNNTFYKTYNISDNIKILNELMQENKKYMLDLFNLLNKMFNKVIDLYKKKRNNDMYNNEKYIEYINNKNEENIKNEIKCMVVENIDNFKKVLLDEDNNYLKEELHFLKNNSVKLSIIETLKIFTKIMEKILLRTTEFNNQKDLIIQNLNRRIIYLLSEIENYNKYYLTMTKNKNNIIDNNNTSYNNIGNNNCNNEEIILLKSQINLKNEEIIRLNKAIDSYIKIIEQLQKNNNIIKDKLNKIDGNEKNEENKNIINGALNKINISEKERDINIPSLKEVNSSLINTQKDINNIIEKIKKLEEIKKD